MGGVFKGINQTSEGVGGERRRVPLKSTANTGSLVSPHILVAPALGDIQGDPQIP